MKTFEYLQGVDQGRREIFSKLEELVNNADASLWGFMESIQKLIDDNKE